MEKDTPCKQKKSGLVSISDKLDLTTRKIINNKNGHYIMLKGTIPNEYDLNQNQESDAEPTDRPRCPFT